MHEHLYRCFTFRLYKESKIDSDAFKDCDSITNCIIDNVNDKLTEIGGKNA